MPNNQHSSKDLKNTIFPAFKIVYLYNPVIYIGTSIPIFILFWVIFNMLDQLLYFSPILYFYIPEDAQVEFIRTNISAALLGIGISMNIYN